MNQGKTRNSKISTFVFFSKIHCFCINLLVKKLYGNVFLDGEKLVSNNIDKLATFYTVRFAHVSCIFCIVVISTLVKAVVGETFPKWGAHVHVQKAVEIAFVKRSALTIDPMLIVLLKILSKILNVKVRAGPSRKKWWACVHAVSPVPPLLSSRKYAFLQSVTSCLVKK